MIEKSLIDRFGRRVSYLRVSVTDRCDFRCVYCMAESMQFLPKAQILTLEEHYRLCKNFVEMGVRKIRLTGGEPLIRKNIMGLIERLGALPGLDELVLTTNGSHLAQYAKPMKDAGVKRINISIDSLQPDRFQQITRVGKLAPVIAGIDAAVAAGFQRLKLNSIIIKGRNEDEVIPLVNFAIDRGIDISFIEEMPLGTSLAYDRAESFMSSGDIRSVIEAEFGLTATTEDSGGPARYFMLQGSSTRIGFISPHSHNFCDTCNRVRLTSEGRLLLCLGNEHSVDLRGLLRSSDDNDDQIKQALLDAMQIKPEKHEFDLNEEPQLVRFMNMTGG